MSLVKVGVSVTWGQCDPGSVSPGVRAPPLLFQAGVLAFLCMVVFASVVGSEFMHVKPASGQCPGVFPLTVMGFQAASTSRRVLHR